MASASSGNGFAGAGAGAGVRGDGCVRLAKAEGFGVMEIDRRTKNDHMVNAARLAVVAAELSLILRDASNGAGEKVRDFVMRGVRPSVAPTETESNALVEGFALCQEVQELKILVDKNADVRTIQAAAEKMDGRITSLCRDFGITETARQRCLRKGDDFLRELAASK